MRVSVRTLNTKATKASIYTTFEAINHPRECVGNVIAVLTVHRHAVTFVEISQPC